MGTMEKITSNTSAKDCVMLPKFLYGTAWKENDTERCVRDALKAGFRGIDTACQRKHYFEAGVGDALKEVFAAKELTRSEVFIQTKFTFARGQDHRLPYDPKAPIQKQVHESMAQSCKNLGIESVDSYVLHGPSSAKGLGDDDWNAWAAMEALQMEGRTRWLGISNVSLDQLKELSKKSKIKPKFVQNRCYARAGWDEGIRLFCQQNDICYQGFSLLTANPEIFRSPKFNDIVRRSGLGPAQVVFNFCVQVGMIPITGTTSAEHMSEDLNSFSRPLADSDIDTLSQISRTSSN